MINQLPNLNWISVLLAFVAYFLLGALWFTLFFSKAYKKSLGRENEILENKLTSVFQKLCFIALAFSIKPAYPAGLQR